VTRLSLSSLKDAKADVQRPAYDPARLTPGMVHLGVGAFQRAHMGSFIDDAIANLGGDWGVVGVSMRKPDVADSLNGQDGLYTVETLGQPSRYRVIGCNRAALCLPRETETVLGALAAPTTRLITLTVTEKGYCLGPEGLDLAHPDIVHDLATPDRPVSAIGVLAAGLKRRRDAGLAAVTVISCDNLMDNGQRLGLAVQALAERQDKALARWIGDEIAFPNTMVDCIVPASDATSRQRVDEALGLADLASVQREPFAQWVIEDRFTSDRPAWEKVGVEMVPQVDDARRLKLHVLNAAHSALAYLGLERGHEFVRQAAADPVLAGGLDLMMRTEIAPALPGLPVRAYWDKTMARFLNPMIDHRLDQIAQDGAFKLAQRLYPLMISNRRLGLPIDQMTAIVQAWLRTPQGDASSLPSELISLPGARRPARLTP
jgi:fructuronate reductase